MQKTIKFCDNCGRAIPPDVKICPLCGAAQTNYPESPVRPATTDNTIPTVDTPYNQSAIPGLVVSTRLIFKEAFTYRHRLGRADYWWSALGFFLLGVVQWSIYGLLTWGTVGTDAAMTPVLTLYLLISFPLSLVCWFASLTAEIRRFHDIGHSGWFWLLNLIPFIGSLAVVILLCQPSRQQSNPYL